MAHAYSAQDLISTVERPRTKPILRYPGGKQRLLGFLGRFLPEPDAISGKYVEPFVGGGAAYFSLQPSRALLSDANAELIELYRDIAAAPEAVWAAYAAFGDKKDDYERLRKSNPKSLLPADRAARLLYLNRTCFKGNWRQNALGEFTVGYGGQSRRWVVDLDLLCRVGEALSNATLRHSDFEPVLDECRPGDFVYLDPPYRKGERELSQQHYGSRRFSFADHSRLAKALARCTERGVSWSLTTSSHADILREYEGRQIVAVPGYHGKQSGEVVITTLEGRDARVL